MILTRIDKTKKAKRHKASPTTPRKSSETGLSAWFSRR